MNMEYDNSVVLWSVRLHVHWLAGPEMYSNSGARAPRARHACIHSHAHRHTRARSSTHNRNDEHTRDERGKRIIECVCSHMHETRAVVFFWAVTFCLLWRPVVIMSLSCVCMCVLKHDSRQNWIMYTPGVCCIN